MVLQTPSYTSGLHQHIDKTAGLDPLHGLGQVDGPTLSSSSSILKESCTASRKVAMVSSFLGTRQIMRLKSGLIDPRHPLVLTSTSIAIFSSWRIVNYMALKVTSSSSFQSPLFVQLTRSELALAVGRTSNSSWLLSAKIKGLT